MKQYILAATRGEQAQALTPPMSKEALIPKLSEFKRNWTGWKIQIRTPEGFKANPFYKR